MNVCFRWLVVNEIKAFDSPEINPNPKILMLTDRLRPVIISASSEQHTWALTFSSFRHKAALDYDTVAVAAAAAA